MQERNHQIGHVLLVIVVLTWGANFGIVKSAFDTVPPLLFGALRFSMIGILRLLAAFSHVEGIRNADNASLMGQRPTSRPASASSTPISDSLLVPFFSLFILTLMYL